MKKRVLINLIVLLSSLCVVSQSLQNDVIATVGESDTVEKLLVSWTIGESVVATFSNMDCIITQGFHQSYFRLTEIPEKVEVPFEVDVYPNPTLDFVHIVIQSPVLDGEYKIVVTDMQGRSIQEYQTKVNKIVRVDLRKTATVFLLLHVIHLDSDSHKVFKIVKTTH